MNVLSLTAHVYESDRGHAWSITVMVDDAELPSLLASLQGLKSAYGSHSNKTKAGAAVKTATLTVTASLNGKPVDNGGPWSVDNSSMNLIHDEFKVFEKNLIDLRL